MANVYFKALINYGATNNIINSYVFNKMPLHIRRRKNITNPNLTSVTGYKLDAKGSIHLDVRRDNRIVPRNFIICNNFPYEAIIGTIFLRSNKVLLDKANERLVYRVCQGKGFLP
jgi:hypothetical protein